MNIHLFLSFIRLFIDDNDDGDFDGGDSVPSSLMLTLRLISTSKAFIYIHLLASFLRFTEPIVVFTSSGFGGEKSPRQRALSDCIQQGIVPQEGKECLGKRHKLINTAGFRFRFDMIHKSKGCS